MTYLTESVEKVAESIAEAKAARPFNMVDKIYDANSALIVYLRLIADRIDALDEKLENKE